MKKMPSLTTVYRANLPRKISPLVLPLKFCLINPVRREELQFLNITLPEKKWKPSQCTTLKYQSFSTLNM